MISLNITLTFRDEKTGREVRTKNTLTYEYDDFDYKSFKYEVDEETTVKEIYEYALGLIQKFDIDFIDEYVIFYTDIMFMFFLQDPFTGKRKIVENPYAKILKVLEYLEIGKEFKLFNCGYGLGGNWKLLDGIRLFTHSNEENHKHVPHIHTEYRDKEASYNILNGIKLAGEKYPSKIEKRIEREILKNREELLKFWNDTTNGIFNPSFPEIEKIKS